ncbi:MAG: Ca-activated chloride channel [Blastocatellia bacterium]|nr:Ca-activated chloride channel [Blastocatellia bacterium]
MSMQLPKPKRLAWLLIPAVLVSLITGLPSKSRAQEKERVDVLKVETDLVVFDAQVIDKKTRRVIGDLSKADFELYEQGVKQPISYFGRDELPLSIMLLLDVSGSVRPILHQIRDGALSALQRLKPQDQVAIMAFANISNLAQDFTKDRSLAARKIEEATATDALGRGTLLGPALASAAFHMQTAATQPSRRVIIVVTDNIAFASGAEQREILEGLFDSGTVVYGLIVRAAFGKVFNVLFLGQIKGVNKFVEETGGEVLGASKGEVDQKLGLVIDRLRARYALGFRSASSTTKDEFRPVVIKISSARKRKEKPLVLTKRGYYLRRR